MRGRILWFLLLAVALSAPAAFAQSAGGSTGTIQGEVVDSSGGALPGVTVTATSPAMLGTKTDTTNAQGIYRFPGLPAGVYKLTFALPGFGTVVKDDIRIGIGFTAAVNTTMAVQSRQEEVTVTGESPVVDTTATRVQTNFDKMQLDSLPNARDMWSLLASTPAVQLNRFDVGGSTAGTQTTYIAYGNGGQNRPLIEGINTTEGTSASGFYFDYGSFDEVIIGTAGNTAEMPSGGVITNFIGKQGGNRFSGEGYFEYENRNIQGTNVTADQLARGFANIPRNVIQQLGLKRDQANTLLDYKNFNASVGGPIMKDKLWFWAGYLRQQNVVYQPASGAILDGTEFLTKLVNYTGKLTYQMTAKDKLIGYMQWGTKFQPFRTDAGFVSGPQHLTSASTLNQQSPSWVGKLEYNRTFGSRGFFELRAGEFGYNFGLLGNDQTTPRREDRATLLVTGGGRDWELDRRRKQVHGAYTFYVDQFAGGNHQFKVGGEVQHETGRTIWKQYYANNVLQVLNNGAASAVRLGLPVDSWNGLRNYGLYANDSYSLHRLTLNVGVRYDRYRVFLPEQDRAASRFAAQAAHFDPVDSVKTFNHVVPRVGAIYNVTGDGKTLWKANLGRYYFNPGVGLADSVNPNTSTQFTEYSWNDLNGDLLWQPGEEGTLIQQQGGTANVIFDPNLRNSYTNELSTWLERELPGQIGVRAGFVWKMDRDGYQRENRNRPFSAWNVPATVTDIGPDGLANSGDERTVSALGLNPVNAALPVVNFVFNPDGFKADYKSVELGMSKRFTHKWSMVSSFLITWTDEFGTNYASSGPGSNVGSDGSLFGGFASTTAFPITPNGKADRSKFSVWTFKVFGSYEPGWGVRLTPVFNAQQGYPYGRNFNTSVNGITQNFLAEAITAHRAESPKVLNFRAEKGFKITGHAKLAVIADVYNVFNENTELNVNARTGRLTISETAANVSVFGDGRGVPITILPPRIARFSARLSW
jgi:hypothetical protein